MAVGAYIQAWRASRGCSLEALAAKAQIDAYALEKIESDEVDPGISTLEALAGALNIPVAWLFTHPASFQHLFADDEGAEVPPGPDPVTERILSGSRMDRSLFVLLTTLIQSAEPKLLRAAEMSLRSLVKQSKQATVPWQNRPSGHFEPPSD